MKQLLVSITVLFSLICSGQKSKKLDYSYINVKDIIELKDLIYFKSDTTLVTGRIIQYDKKNKPNKFVLVSKGKADKLGWQPIYKKGFTELQESALGNLLLGVGQVLDMTNTINIPTVRQNHSSDPNIDTYRKYNKQFIKQEIKELSDRNRIYNNLTPNDFSNLNEEHKDGPFKEFYNNKRLKSKGNYFKGKKHGAWENYNSNGNLKSKRNYIEGIKNGLWIEYYDNGKIESKVNYLKGKNEGIMEMYYLDGTLKIRLNYINGKEDGLMEMFHNNGQLYIKGSFKEGKEIGDWRTYNNTGKLVKTENF